MYQVVKRDGKIVEFDINKIAAAIISVHIAPISIRFHPLITKVPIYLYLYGSNIMNFNAMLVI